jgi:activator of HSP90 ATPase
MSTWNDGKFFWEEHNVNDWAKTRLNELVSGLQIEGWTFSDFNFSSISAARSIRKAREIRTFEIVFDCKFKYNGLEGKISFPDISEDAGSAPEDWEGQVTFTGTSADKSAAEKKVVRGPAEKVAVPAFQKLFAQWAAEFKALPAESPPSS